MLRTGGFALFFLFAITFSVAGQKHCSCMVDTNRILLNSDLDEFLSGLKHGTFITYSQKKDIPKFIMDQLDCLTGSFSLANPGQEYRCCCTSSTKLPKRKLLYFAVSRDMFVMTYLTGGIGVESHLLLIKFSGQKIEKLWTGLGDGNLKSPGGIFTFIKSRRYKEWGLNTNMITL